MRDKVAIAILAVLTIATPLAAQAQKPHSEEECVAKLPPSTSPYEDDQQERDAIYYSCRLGVSKDDVRSWDRQLGKDHAPLWDAITAKNRYGEFVILTTMEGTAHCQYMTVMKKAADAWVEVWKLPDRMPLRLKHCAKGCPLMKVSLDPNCVLSVGIPADSNQVPALKCKRKWLRYRWNGKTFSADQRG